MSMKVRYTTVDGELIAEKRNGVRRLYVPDPLGSTVALLDNTQTQTDTFTYWPYGEVRTSTGTTPPPFQFVGTQGYYSDAVGRIYVRARHLHTQKGRWLTENPIGFRLGDVNLYRYGMSTPTLVVDFQGLADTQAQSNPLPRRTPPPLDPCTKVTGDIFSCLHCCEFVNGKKRKFCDDQLKACVFLHGGPTEYCDNQVRACYRTATKLFENCENDCFSLPSVPWPPPPHLLPFPRKPHPLPIPSPPPPRKCPPILS